jgi:pentatricopeptide repeat protein
MTVENALVTMYSKCGTIDDALKLFDAMICRDIISWNAMITGYAQHGRCLESLNLFEQMQSRCIKPNEISFVGVLSACSHAGLVDEGWHYYSSMRLDHGIVPGVEHYACMVDLLGRAGQLDKAENLMNDMPFGPNAFVCRTLLGACRVHGNLEVGKRVAECLIELDPQDAATYVTLSNIYAAAGRWETATKVRKMMKDRGVRKDPGFSWIEVKSRVHAFVLGDQTHLQTEEIYASLERLTGQID